MVLENSLQLAFKRDEFILYYQPQIDLTTGQITGLEALARWQKPGVDLVLPEGVPAVNGRNRIISIAW